MAAERRTELLTANGWQESDFDRTVQKIAQTGIEAMGTMVPEPPAEPLVGPFMATDEEVILFGPGGAGKGTTATWLAREYLRTNQSARVLILDFENRRSEWAHRKEAFGMTPEEQERCFWASPYSKQWTARRGALTHIWESVQSDCDKYEITLLIVDSYSAATTTSDAMGGQGPANEYFDALRKISRRSLTLAHVPGNAQKWPERPFGSTFVHNWARETWAIEQIDMDTGTGESEHGLTYHRVELRCKKAQNRPKPPHQRITYMYDPLGNITATMEAGTNNGDLIYKVLSASPGVPLTTGQISKTIKAETGEVISEAQVYDAIRRRNRSRDDIKSDTTKRPHTYWME